MLRDAGIDLNWSAPGVLVSPPPTALAVAPAGLVTT